MNKNSEAGTTEEILNALHTKKCQEMEASGELYDYLMDCQQYLKTQDLTGWKLQFLPPPAPPPQQPPQKRMKMTPSAFLPQAPDLCTNCSTPTIEDRAQGMIVCKSCGLIQSQDVFMAWGAHSMSREFTGNPNVYIHHYDRRVYFQDLVRFLHGESRPKIPGQLRAEMEKCINPKNGIKEVMQFLKSKNVANKYRRHKYSILVQLGGPPLLDIPIEARLRIYKMFKSVNYFWPYCHNKIAPGRLVFFPYALLLYQFMRHLNIPAPQELLPKNSLGMERHLQTYRELCQVVGFKCYEVSIK